MTCGEYICEYLKRVGVDTVFGIPGTQSVSLFECTRKSSLRIVLTASEFGATLAANGYFRSSGRPAASTSIQGPGFTLASTGLAEAYHDSSALIHLLIKSPQKTEKAFLLQDLDHQEISKSITKGYFVIDKPEEVAEKMARACHLAVSGEPGPVVIELDSQIVDQNIPPSSSPLKMKGEETVNEFEALDSMVDAIQASKRATLFIGQGAANCASEIVTLAEMLNSPVITNCSGRGNIPDSHRLAVCSDFGSWGIKTVNDLIKRSDLVLAIGCKFTHNGSAGYRIKIPKEKLIHIDASDRVLNANYPASIAITADAASLIPQLIEKLRDRNTGPSEWTDNELKGFKDRHETDRQSVSKLLPVPRDPGNKKDLHIFEALRETLPEKSVVVTDSGLNQLIVRTKFRCECARGLIAPTDFQSMGYSIPAAMGAGFARPDIQVVAVVGDGGMLMSGIELSTAVRENIKLLVIIMNDNRLGQIRIKQLSEYGKGQATKTANIDFEKIANGIGANYIRLHGDYTAEFRRALNLPGVTIVEIPMKDTLHTYAKQSKATARKIGRAVGAEKLRDLIKRLARLSS